jgi:hypothetical protein
MSQSTVTTACPDVTTYAGCESTERARVERLHGTRSAIFDHVTAALVVEGTVDRAAVAAAVPAAGPAPTDEPRA